METTNEELTEEDVARVFNKDAMNYQSKRWFKVMKALEKDPRATLQQLSKKSGIPLSSVHDEIKKINKRFEMRVVFKKRSRK